MATTYPSKTGIPELKISNRNTICLIGDSITERDHFTGATGYRVVSPTSVFGWLNYLLGQRLKPLNIDAADYSGNALAGVSGNTTTQILARWGAAVAPHDCGHIWLRAGYNDVVGDVSAATIKANITKIISLAKDKKALLWLSSIMPGTGVSTVARADAWYEVNNWIRQTAQSTDGVIYVPQGQSYIDGTGSYPQPLAGYTDGVHQYSHTAYRLAVEAYSAVDKVIPEAYPPFAGNYNASLANGAGVWENPLLTGTAGTLGTGASGSVADECTAEVGGGGAVVCSKVARTDINGAEWQQLAFTCDAAFTNLTTDYAQFKSNSGVALNNLSDGDKIQLFVEYEMDASPTDFGGMYCWIQFGAPNTSEYANQLRLEATVNDVSLDTQVQSGVMATMPMAIPTGSTTAFPNIRVVAGAANATFTCRIGRITIVKVD